MAKKLLHKIPKIFFFAGEVKYKSLVLLPKRGFLEYYEATSLPFSWRSTSRTTKWCIWKLLLMIRPIEWKQLHGHTTSKTFFIEGNVTFPRFGQKRRQYQARNVSYFVVFGGRLWLQRPLKIFLGLKSKIQDSRITRREQ